MRNNKGCSGFVCACWRLNKLTASFADFSRRFRTSTAWIFRISPAKGRLSFRPGEPKPHNRTALIVDHHCDVLYMHEHSNHGLSASNVAQYFRDLSGIGKLVAKPILKTQALLRFQRQKRYTALRVGLAGIENGQFLRDRGLSRGAVIDMIDQYRTPNLKFEVSLDRGARVVDSPSVIEAVSVFLGLPPQNLKKLQVIGSESSETPDFPVDSIRDRITFALEVELAKGTRPKDAQTAIGPLPPRGGSIMPNSASDIPGRPRFAWKLLLETIWPYLFGAASFGSFVYCSGITIASLSRCSPLGNRGSCRNPRSIHGNGSRNSHCGWRIAVRPNG